MAVLGADERGIVWMASTQLQGIRRHLRRGRHRAPGAALRVAQEAAALLSTARAQRVWWTRSRDIGGEEEPYAMMMFEREAPMDGAENPLVYTKRKHAWTTKKTSVTYFLFIFVDNPSDQDSSPTLRQREHVHATTVQLT